MSWRQDVKEHLRQSVTPATPRGLQPGSQPSRKSNNNSKGKTAVVPAATEAQKVAAGLANQDLKRRVELPLDELREPAARAVMGPEETRL